jgi:hypothetical protein
MMKTNEGRIRDYDIERSSMKRFRSQSKEITGHEVLAITAMIKKFTQMGTRTMVNVYAEEQSLRSVGTLTNQSL